MRHHVSRSSRAGVIANDFEHRARGQFPHPLASASKIRSGVGGDSGDSLIALPYQTTTHVSVLRTPTAPAIPMVVQFPSDWRLGLST